MTPQEFDKVLANTLNERRLSGGEASALAAVLARIQVDEAKRALYLHQAFEQARSALSSREARPVLDWLEEVVKLLQSKGKQQPAGELVEAYFSPDDDCPQKLNRLFRQARRGVDVCVFTITDDRISSAILDAARRGVALRIITDNDKAFDAGSDIPRFRAAGIPLKVDETEYHMHHKFAIFDGALLVTGSYNWTRGAADHNLENFIVTNNRGLIEAYGKTFEKLWKGLP